MKKLKSILTKEKLTEAAATVVLTATMAFAAYGISEATKALAVEFKAKRNS